MKHRLNESLRRRGFEIVPSARLYDWQHKSVDQPAGAADYLRPDNPKLLDLQNRYRAFNAQVTASSDWTNPHVRQEYLTYFRGDNAWVWQVPDTNAHILAHALCLFYLKSIDRLGLLDKLSFPSIDSYLCADAEAVSTFVCDCYLRFRGVVRGVEKACAVPLDAVDVALAEHRVQYLMIVPNRAADRGERLLTYEGHDFLPILQRHGYLVVQQYGPFPSWRHLLELRS